MAQHRGLLIAWTLVVGAFLVGIFGGFVELVILPQLGAMALSFVTLRQAGREGGLRYALLYRTALALLLVAAATCLVAAGSTAIVEHRDGAPHIAGFVALSTTNLVVSILSWRALVRPTPRRAALAGLIAVVIETVAMLSDLLFNIRSNIPSGPTTAVALYASFVATWTGALVCMAAVGTFERADAAAMPEARVVDED